MVISLVDYKKKKEEQARAPSSGEDLRNIQKASDRVSALDPLQRKIIDDFFGISSGKPDQSIKNQHFSAKQHDLLADSLRALRQNANKTPKAEPAKLKLVK